MKLECGGGRTGVRGLLVEFWVTTHLRQTALKSFSFDLYFSFFFGNIGSFLTYRELDTKRRPRRSSTQSSPSRIGGGHISCSYKPNGLIKQSFSICTASNQKIHLISYYSKYDVIHGRLSLPSMDPHIGKIVIPKGLYPELNPLDTSGGHSATLHLMMKASMDKQQQQQQCVVDSNSSVTSTDSYGSNSNSYYNYTSKRGAVQGHPPSLSSSPLSSCSDDDFFSSSSYTALTTQPKPPSLIIPDKLTSPTPKSPLSLPIQVGKAYFLQSEDTRQLEALKTQLRIWYFKWFPPPSPDSPPSKSFTLLYIDTVTFMLLLPNFNPLKRNPTPLLTLTYSCFPSFRFKQKHSPHLKPTLLGTAFVIS